MMNTTPLALPLVEDPGNLLAGKRDGLGEVENVYNWCSLL